MSEGDDEPLHLSDKGEQSLNKTFTHAVAFNSEDATAELIKSYVTSVGPKLSFAEKCAVFHALRQHIPPSIVAKAFGITAATASNIKSASVRGRYHEVARELERLGELEFRDRYYTDDAHTRLMRVKYKAEVTDRYLGAPNRKANKFAVDKVGPHKCGNQLWAIFYRECAADVGDMPEDEHESGSNEGWIFAECDHVGEPVKSMTYRHHGKECLNPKTAHGPTVAFRTSGDALEALLTFSGERDRRD